MTDECQFLTVSHRPAKLSSLQSSIVFSKPTMNPSEALSNHRDAVLAIAASIGARNVRVFGSVLHGRDTVDSDLDLLVDVPKGTTLLDMARLQRTLEEELGVSVDVLTPGDLPAKFRDDVLREAKPL